MEEGVFLQKKNPRVAYLDAEKVYMPLIIRNARPGDRFQPFGMKGEKKIKNFFIDEKVPRVKENVFRLFFLVICSVGWEV